jgi:hypothetical protein
MPTPFYQTYGPKKVREGALEHLRMHAETLKIFDPMLPKSNLRSTYHQPKLRQLVRIEEIQNKAVESRLNNTGEVSIFKSPTNRV